jgi:hypothetical protein
MQPPPESPAEKIKKQIIRVGDGLVSFLPYLPSPCSAMKLIGFIGSLGL